MSEREPILYQASTDILGIRQNPEIMRKLAYSDDVLKYLQGFEIIPSGYPFQIRYFMSEIESETGKPVVRIHGQTGGKPQSAFDWVKLTAAEKLFIPNTNDYLLVHFSDTEFLIHAPEALKPQVDKELKRKKANSQIPLWIENHPELDGINHTITAITHLRDHQAPVSGMLDLVHAMRYEWADLDMHETIETISKTLKLTYQGNYIFHGIHFPIGTVPYDSLPLKTMTDDDLRELAAVIHESPGIRVLTLENQQESTWDSISLRTDLRKRNDAIVDRLVKTHVINV